MKAGREGGEGRVGEGRGGEGRGGKVGFIVNTSLYFITYKVLSCLRNNFVLS